MGGDQKRKHCNDTRWNVVHSSGEQRHPARKGSEKNRLQVRGLRVHGMRKHMKCALGYFERGLLFVLKKVRRFLFQIFKEIWTVKYTNVMNFTETSFCKRFSIPFLCDSRIQHNLSLKKVKQRVLKKEDEVVKEEEKEVEDVRLMRVERKGGE